MMKYRNLTSEEIKKLEAAGCVARNWSDVLTSASSLDPARIRGVNFIGPVRMGTFDKEFSLPGNVVKPSGIRNATLSNVTVGDNCLIENVANYISNYEIGEDSCIDNVDLMFVEGECTFGNGVEVSVMNETGGREVRIHEKLTAQVAYILTMYRHRPELTAQLNALADEFANSRRSTSGKIASNVIIRNTRYINGVNVGPYAVISGASRLRNGTIVSNASAPVCIGHGVIADDFIICSGSSVEDNTTVDRCFIGQSCHFGHGYSASDSLFFCNCVGENGEACAIFAGPFTVTHHKSTLLIAGMFSFMNAGSGSNQSNHLYKLGPIHQGILERGCKTASDSYILWPSRIGAFSLVMGRHATHSDTTNLPFSYLIEQQNSTFLAPAVSLRSVGTIRDAQKWPKRDGRKDPDKLDNINYNLLSPFTVQKMLKGIQLLKNLQYSSGELSDVYSYHSTKIKNSSLTNGIRLYRVAVTKFLGNSIINRLGKLRPGASDQEIREALIPDTPHGSGFWVDLGGMIAPKALVEDLMNRIEKGEICGVEAINASLADIHRNYYSYEWTWAYDKYKDFFGIALETITVAEVISIVKMWKEAVIGLDKMLYEDARKEFNLASMTGFGADGSKEDKEHDFEQVRGDFESNAFVKAVLDHIKTKEALGDELIARLSGERN